MHTHVVFCEFEGALTEADAVLASLERFAAPASQPLLERLGSDAGAGRETVRRALQTIPSDRYEHVLAWARELELRDGLAELLDFLEQHDSPLIVFTGGLRAVVDAALGPLAPRVERIYGVEAELSSDSLRANSDVESATRLVDGPEVVRRHPSAEAVVIAGRTDSLEVVGAAQLAFARGPLADCLDDEAVPYQSFRTFHDVRRFLERHWPAR